jgi:MtN3 and saliva related transmembrane protein
VKELVAALFGFGMAINACLFVPQAWRLWKTRDARGLSVLSFAGFNTLQFIGALHGYFQRDYALMWGMIATLVTCGSITLLALRFNYLARRSAAVPVAGA